MILVTLFVLSACNTNAAEVIDSGKMTVSEDMKSITFHATISDNNLDENTQIMTRFYIEAGSLRQALGTDLIFVENELKRGSEPETHEVSQSVEFKDSSLVADAIKQIKDTEKETVTIEVLNDDGMIDEQAIYLEE